MEEATLLAELFADYADDSKPSATIMARAVRKAQNEVGYAVLDILADSEERDWLENRVERFAIDSLLKAKAEDFTYNKAKLAEVFANFRKERDSLDKDWIKMKTKVSAKKGFGGFQSFGPGFEYDKFGRTF